MTNAITLETSHGRTRATTPRLTDGGIPPLPEPDDTVPTRDPDTGRFVKGNREHRRRQAKALVAGVGTLNPARVDPWLQPFVVDGARYALELAVRFPSHPMYARAAGDLADARAVYRALLQLGATGDAKALAEAKGWLREVRALMATLAAMARVVTPEPPTDPIADMRRAAEDAAERRANQEGREP